MPGPGIDGECRECNDGRWECGVVTCAPGGGGPPWDFQGTAWLPIEMGLDAAIRIYTRVEFAKKKGKLVIDKASGEPEYVVQVRLDMPLRTQCVTHTRCPDPDRDKPKRKTRTRRTTTKK